MKSKLLITLLLLTASITTTCAQLNFSWVKTGGTFLGADRGRKIASAPNGNIYWGYRSSNSTVVAAFDTLGNFVDSLVIAGDDNNSADLQDIGIDNNGNLFICGGLSGTVDFDPSAGIDTITAPNLSTYGYIAKYNSSFQLLWAKDLACDYTVVPHDLIIDNDGNLYITGDFTGTCNFNPDGQANLSSDQFTTNVFIAKYNNSGAYVWAKRATAGPGNSNGLSMALDDNNNIFLTGDFYNTCNFNPDGSAPLSSITQYKWDVFIAKYTNTGTYSNAMRLGGNGNDIVSHLFVKGNDLIVTGNFKDTIDFNPGGTNNIVYCNADGDFATFVAKYDLNYNFQWAKGIVGTEEIYSNGAFLDNNGNVYLSGYFITNCNFGTQNLTSNGAFDGFYAKYSPAGNLIVGDKLGGTDNDNCLEIFATNTKIYVTGSFTQSVDFDPDPNDQHIITGGFVDAFLIQYGDNTTDIKQVPVNAKINIYPNPAKDNITIELAENKGKENFMLYDVLGNQIFNQTLTNTKTTVRLNGLSSGIYLWRCGNNAGKLIVE